MLKFTAKDFCGNRNIGKVTRQAPFSRLRIAEKLELTYILARRTIFDHVEFNYEILAHRLRELAFLNRGIMISIRDNRSERFQEFKYDGGIASFIGISTKTKMCFMKIRFIFPENQKMWKLK
ncbi:MAG: hypothetical protein CM1200mP30_09870 [Pseudomonadota bacterium]|nr:MAG: hypothetical protein CM1200mP30_09870 [Pseudomonadota bacterium]